MMAWLHELVRQMAPTGWELFGGLSFGVALLGVWLRWRSQWDVAEVEEAQKNHGLADDAVQRRIRFIAFRANALIFGGLALLLVAVCALGH